MKKYRQSVVTTLWTGGLDSTYRVLNLIVERDCTVQPLYLLDKERASSPVELRTMDSIRSQVGRHFPEAARRLLPTTVVDVESVKSNPAITAMCSRLRLGSQYDWLARYATAEGLDDIELGLVKGGPLERRLRPDIEMVDGAVGRTLRLRRHLENPDLEIFRRFSFPILNLTKKDMGHLAEKGGYSHLMQLTWFCHSPKWGKPCGCCDPCMIALKAGMGERIPLFRQVRPRLRFVRDGIRQQLNGLTGRA